jgi:uncharacterized repeat protein (TIGR03809 family)
MSARPPAHALDAVAQKWRALAERRREHLVELYDSGRWKHYYTEGELLYRMREAIQQAERWAEIAPRPEDEIFAEQVRSEAARRTAA